MTLEVNQISEAKRIKDSHGSTTFYVTHDTVVTIMRLVQNTSSSVIKRPWNHARKDRKSTR